ncbi:MAG: carbohydrate ABC transporter permease [Clostridia bacterium]|nr:carbohydrate ABC transporter permease [Clostridia bacterium]MBQ5602521.1 carbohydrate ABC transporter permease [Clostridia bacterium]
MNSAKTNSKVLKESKNKIRVEFERTSRWERFKTKYLSMHFATTVIWKLFRYVILIGMCYIILNPWFSIITESFMSVEDFADVTVNFVPKHFTIDTYKALIIENNYLEAVLNTGLLSIVCALLQTFVCSLVGYGFAKYKFKGSGILFTFVLITMMVPTQTIKYALFLQFKNFDILGIFGLLGLEKVSLLNTMYPFIILSLTGIGLKNGLYIFMMRQFYRGVPDELEESAYIDGSSVTRTFFKIILPISIPMMITIFVFAFSWTWTDNFYSTTFYTNNQIVQTLAYFSQDDPESLRTLIKESGAAGILYQPTIKNTCAILVGFPLIIIYLFCQRYLIQGIERSGITG